MKTIFTIAFVAMAALAAVSFRPAQAKSPAVPVSSLVLVQEKGAQVVAQNDFLIFGHHGGHHGHHGHHGGHHGHHG